MMEPMAGPAKYPAPPINVMNTAIPDSCQPRSSGPTLRVNGPQRAPAIPANAPAMTKLTSM